MHVISAIALAAPHAVVARADEHPRHGDVYREFATHQSGNAWRVTELEPRHERARRHLPNPVLHVAIDDLTGAIRAEAVLDRWGGHDGTLDKRIRFNGGDWLPLAEPATMPAGTRPEDYFYQDNPVVEVPLADLHTGDNTFEGLCGTSRIGWGQWGLYSLILRVYYDAAVVEHATARITAPETGGVIGEIPTIAIEAVSPNGVARVDVLAWYEGLDEDGDGVFREWHAAHHQPLRGAAADLREHVGTVWRSPYELTWNTRHVPDQAAEGVRLVARVQDARGAWSVTEVVDRLSLVRAAESVRMYTANQVPTRCGVRAGKSLALDIPIAGEDEPRAIVEAALALRTWNGSDHMHQPLEFNGRRFAIGGKNHHYDFDLHALPPSLIRRGRSSQTGEANRLVIRSETTEHALELLWPGPMLIVRYAKAGAVE